MASFLLDLFSFVSVLHSWATISKLYLMGKTPKGKVISQILEEVGVGGMFYGDGP